MSQSAPALAVLGRSTDPAHVSFATSGLRAETIRHHQQLSQVFGWNPFTPAEARQVLDARRAVRQWQEWLRRLHGVRVDNRMLVACHDGRSRIVHGVTPRESVDFDEFVMDTHGVATFGWPEVWAARDTTPFPTLPAPVFRAAWEAWAQVDGCRCGTTGLHVETSEDRWRVVRRDCRAPIAGIAAFAAQCRLAFGWGEAFTAADVIAAGIPTDAIGAIAGDERSTGRALSRLADSTPPTTGWWIVRLGPGGGATGSRARRGVTAWAAVSWDQPSI